MRLFSQYDDHERNYKPVNDICFSLINLNNNKKPVVFDDSKYDFQFGAEGP